MSHKIKVYRQDTYAPLSDVTDKELEEWKNEGSRIKSGRRSSATKKEIYTGLTPEQKKLILPLLIDLTTDQTYEQRQKLIKEFYDNLYVKIPAPYIELEIGLIDPKKKLGEILNDKLDPNEEGYMNLPINPKDYVIYYAIFENDPVVAKNYQLAKENPLMEYYLMDSIAEKKLKAELQDKRDEALTHYLGIKKDEKFLDKVVMLLNVDLKADNSLGNKQSSVQQFSQDYPEKYLETVEDDDFNEKYQIKLLEKTLIVSHSMEGYYDVQTKEVLALNIDEMIVWMKNPLNSEKIAEFKSSVQRKLAAASK